MTNRIELQTMFDDVPMMKSKIIVFIVFVNT